MLPIWLDMLFFNSAYFTPAPPKEQKVVEARSPFVRIFTTNR